MPFFNISENNFNYSINILGIKLKIRSLKLVVDELKKIKQNLAPNLWEWKRNFIWSNNNILTYKEKRWYLETIIYNECNYFPNLDNPKTFNEKLNWMKLNYYNPIQKRCVDKYEFKNYIKEKLGDGYTIPLIGVYNNVNDIDFDSLPDKFVIKTTLNGCGIGIKVIKNKNKIDFNKLKYEYNNMLQKWTSVYYSSLANAYENLNQRIIIEEYLENIEKTPYEYKIFCFHGEPKLFYAINYQKKKELTYYDMNFNRLDFTNGNYRMGKDKVHKPVNEFDKMVELAKFLSKDFPFVRVDFYPTKDKLYIGELTFNPTGGFAKYTPVEWDYKMGEWLDLNKLEKEYIVNNKN